mmetsp:Transcript_20158/g.49400  ORF Transcript_20158/g.49400 Transcript_20158/m.49400 type:complete len:211 (+) Transcript_20158:35-667(+)
MAFVLNGGSSALQSSETRGLHGTTCCCSRKQASPGGDFRRSVAAALGAGVLAAGTILSPLPSANIDAQASDARVVGEIETAGVFFKDVLKVLEVDDPKIAGVKIYITEFEKPLVDRMKTGKVFQQPSSISLTCSRAGPVTVSKDIDKSIHGEEVFVQSRTLSFTKAIDVRRFYDEQTNTVVYASYGSRLVKDDDDHHSRFKASLCAVKLD